MEKSAKESVLEGDARQNPAFVDWADLPSNTRTIVKVRRSEEPATDLIVLSHLRWDFVFQRPQHLLTRFAREQRVFYVEEPVPDSEVPTLEIREKEPRLFVIVPHLPASLDDSQRERAMRLLLDELVYTQRVRDYVLWYYTPMALGFSRHLTPKAVVYDCMDELSAFHFAPPKLKEREEELFRRADLVFTGGQSLYEVKRPKHARVHLFPSSVEVEHFHKARTWVGQPIDQATFPGPRLGFFGVIDERMDFALVKAVAEMHPEWHFVFLGPICKICPSTLPKASNVHFLGAKDYSDLPAYLSGWDVALLPFARNDATRFISPTKTPEYLAAGRPVVSTPIRDVMRPYGERGFVYIAETPREFAKAIEKALELRRHGKAWLEEVDLFLSQNSWDKTWKDMKQLIRPFTKETSREHARDVATLYPSL